MSERFTINQYETLFTVYNPVDGVEACGKNGQIKGASCCGRTITLGGLELNRGSAIDFFREQVLAYNAKDGHAPLALPEKGWFFGYYGGSSEEDIQAIFAVLYPHTPTKTILEAAQDAYMGRNLAMAVTFFKQAADRGDDCARYSLAVLYQTGEGVIQSIEDATHYYAKVTQPEYKQMAHMNMGKMYDDAECDDLAYYHYIEAELLGNEEVLQTLQGRLTPEEAYHKAMLYRDSNPEREFAFLMYAAKQGNPAAKEELERQGYAID